MNSEFTTELYSPITIAIFTAFVTSVVCTLFFKYTSNGHSTSNKKLNIHSKKRDILSASNVFKEGRKIFNTEKRIVSVTDSVHVALGYGLANCIVIQGIT